MCFDNDTPPAPAPDPAIGQAAKMSAELGKDWLDYTKDQAAIGNLRQDKYDDIIDKVVQSELSTQDKANQWAQQDRDLGLTGKAQYDQLAQDALASGSKYEQALSGIAGTYGEQAGKQFDFASGQQDRYKSTFAPVEDRLASDAMNWDSAARLDSEAGKARADVLASAAGAKAAGDRQMASMGINPMSGRFAANDRAADVVTALGAAGAQNAARDNIRGQAISLRQGAAQVGQNVLASGNTAESLGLQATQAKQGAITAADAAKTGSLAQAGQLKAAGLGAAGVGYQGLGTGLSAGSSAVSAQGAGNQQFIASQGITNAGYGGAMQGYANQGNILNNLYGNQLNAWAANNQANAQSSAGFGNLLGTAIGAGASLYL